MFATRLSFLEYLSNTVLAFVSLLDCSSDLVAFSSGIAFIFAISQAPAAERGVATTREMWIAPRSDQKPGTGTERDPYDGHSQRAFDAVMSRIKTGTHVHILPGVYETDGDEGWQPKDNEWIQGSGAGKIISKAGPY